MTNFSKKLLGAAGALALMSVALRLMGTIIMGGGWSIPASTFGAGGGEVAPQAGGRQVTSALGGTALAKMEGGGYTIGTGIVGGFSPAAAGVSAAHPYPVPFIPSQGHAGITFTLLPAEATIRVYTLTGELVKEINKGGGAVTDKVAWSPVENEKGESLASGVYFYIIETPDDKMKTGKLMVIK